MNFNPASDSEWDEQPDDLEDLAEKQAGPDKPPQDESAEAEDGQPTTPTSIGRYQIVRQLGRGGFGFVYLANDPELHRRVAIKVPRWDRPLTRDAIDRFLNEGKLLAQIDYLSIVSVHDLGIDNNIPFVVMQYIEGQTLEKILRARMLPLGRSLKILMQIANALREAHKETIVHRDFKPSNVIIDAKGRIHLVDFGMALHDDLTLADFQARRPVGTPQFMSPEQIRGENHRIDGRTDIWAFGVTMYLMLTGKKPFRGEDRKTLSRGICFRNPRPLRQLNEHVSPELERICLRCMSKLMDERYQSMPDLIDELKAATTSSSGGAAPSESGLTPAGSSTQWSGWPSVASGGGGLSGDWVRDSFQASGESNASASSGEQLHYVPKGLRCFDENDHEFFMRLLPGATDRLGVPESIRFWVGRVGTEQQVQEIPIGIIYGPSGCGKTSFVRAGLIPRIHGDVTPVYIDCTSPDLPQLIIRELANAVDEETIHENLSTCMRKMRQQVLDSGPARKIVLVLDQFEQWLEACQNYAEDELTEALRQCDAGRLQCLLLVRDDYWMSITRFMRCLEQRIEEGRNAMSLPLFDRRHARNVLRSYGRAVGALPPASTALNRQQKRFVKDAVDSISQNGNVLCVHLTILADMLADKEWGNTSFDRALGAESIGSAFLERHLNDSVKVIKSGWLPLCEGIFSELLPPTTQTSLKAHDRERSELVNACGGLRHGDQFDDCIHYLVQNLKLITRVEAASTPENEGSNTTESRFRLTHDFFVIPMRQWLMRRRSATLAGRAKARCEQLCHQYQLNKNKRYLPNPIEYTLFKAFVPTRDSTREKKEFLRDSDRYYAIRLALLTVLIIGASFVGSYFWGQQIARQQMASLYISDVADTASIYDRMLQKPARYIPILERDCESDDVVKGIRSNVGLLILGHNPEKHLNLLLPFVDDAGLEDWQIFSRALESNDRQQVTKMLREFARRETLDLETRSRIAVLELQLGDDQLTHDMFGDPSNPDPRSEFVDTFEQWHCSVEKFCEHLSRTESPDVLYGSFLALAFLAPDEPETRAPQLVRNTLHEGYQKTSDSGVMETIEFCARRWNVDDLPIKEKEFDGHWLQTKTSARLIRVEGVTFERPPHGEESRTGVTGSVRVKLKSFCVSPKEVTVAMYRDYVETLDGDDPIRLHFEAFNWWDNPTQQNTAIRNLEVHHIYKYLNWLSREHGKEEVYVETATSTPQKPIYKTDNENDGYRLPTSDESIWIGRALARRHVPFSWASSSYLESLDDREKKEQIKRFQTNHHSGEEATWSTDDGSILHVFFQNDVDRTAPNRLGFYETSGNIRELCHDNIFRKGRLTLAKGCSNYDFELAFTGNFLVDLPARTSTNAFMGFRIASDSSRTKTE